MCQRDRETERRRAFGKQENDSVVGLGEEENGMVCGLGEKEKSASLVWKRRGGWFGNRRKQLGSCSGTKEDGGAFDLGAKQSDGALDV